MNPRYPVYIISKGRADTRLTSRALEAMGVPYRIVIEETEYPQYAAVIDPRKILLLDPEYQRNYDAQIDLPPGASKGSGPARNFVWDHAVSEGHARHWIMDDNIRSFYRTHQNRQIRLLDGVCFRAMEDFCDRYLNLALAGPHYKMFVPRKAKVTPCIFNTRLYSCILIQNNIPFRWRCRYNEDVDLSLRVLKAGWCTVQFRAFLQEKMTTQTMKGGNTDAFYAAEGTLPKSQMLVRLHPDVVRIVWRYHRWHHFVNYEPFRKNILRKKPDIPVPEGVNDYGMTLVHRK